MAGHRDGARLCGVNILPMAAEVPSVTRRPDFLIYPVFNRLPPFPMPQKEGRPASQCYSVVERATPAFGNVTIGCRIFIQHVAPAHLGNPRPIERENEEYKQPSRRITVCAWHRTAPSPPIQTSPDTFENSAGAGRSNSQKCLGWSESG